MTLPASTRSLGSCACVTTSPAVDSCDVAVTTSRLATLGTATWPTPFETVSFTVLPASTLPGAGSWASTVPAGWSDSCSVDWPVRPSWRQRGVGLGDGLADEVGQVDLALALVEA